MAANTAEVDSDEFERGMVQIFFEGKLLIEFHWPSDNVVIDEHRFSEEQKFMRLSKSFKVWKNLVDPKENLLQIWI